MKSNAHSNRYTVRNMHLVPPTVVPPNHGIFRRPSNDNVAYLRRNPSAHVAKRAVNNHPTLNRAPGAHSVNNYPTLTRAPRAHPLKRAISAHAANNDVNSVKEEREQLCVVCDDEKRNSILYPCKHFCMCIECAKQIQTDFKTCPICRKPIERIVDTSRMSDNKFKKLNAYTALPYIVNLYS